MGYQWILPVVITGIVIIDYQQNIIINNHTLINLMIINHINNIIFLTTHIIVDKHLINIAILITIVNNCDRIWQNPA